MKKIILSGLFLVIANAANATPLGVSIRIDQQNINPTLDNRKYSNLIWESVDTKDCETILKVDTERLTPSDRYKEKVIRDMSSLKVLVTQKQEECRSN